MKKKNQSLEVLKPAFSVHNNGAEIAFTLTVRRGADQAVTAKDLRRALRKALRRKSSKKMFQEAVGIVHPAEAHS